MSTTRHGFEAFISAEDDRGLNWASYFGLVVFALAVLCVNVAFTFSLPLFLCRRIRQIAVFIRLIDDKPREDARLHFSLDLVTAPVLAVLLLLATTAIDGSVVRAGIVGENGIVPYDVLILFISLAYIAITLDATGAIRALAFAVARMRFSRTPAEDGMMSGPLRFFVLYWFFFAVSLVLGNDPVVLSGTAFLAYFTLETGIRWNSAFLYAQFAMANTASACLVSSNPTNVLIAGAFELNFLTGYTKYTVLPALLAAIVGYPLLYLLFTLNKPTVDYTTPEPPSSPILPHLKQQHPTKPAYIPRRISPPTQSPRDALVYPPGAIFHLVVLALTLILLISTTFIERNRPHVWQICFPAGVVSLVYDLVTDYLLKPKPYQSSLGAAVGLKKLPTNELPMSTRRSTVEASDDAPSIATPGIAPMKELQLVAEPETTGQKTDQRWTVQTIWRRFSTRFPATSNTLEILPIKLLPFAFRYAGEHFCAEGEAYDVAHSMFILVRALAHIGWISIWASWLFHAAPNPAAAAFVVGSVTAFFLCALAGTNIGATVLMVSILRHPNFAGRVDERTLRAAVFSLAMASNVGAFGWSVSASLAGLLWTDILERKGTIIRQRDFAKWNALPLVSLTMVCSAVVLGEVYWFAA